MTARNWNIILLISVSGNSFKYQQRSYLECRKTSGQVTLFFANRRENNVKKLFVGKRSVALTKMKN